MERPPLDEAQMAKALEAYYSVRELAWRYVLGAVDPSTTNAPALPMREVLTRVQALATAEMARYAEATPETPAEEQPHDPES